MTLRSYLRSSTAVSLVSALATSAIAADLSVPPPVFTQLPAVDGLNGKVEAFGAGIGFPNFRSPILDTSIGPNPYRPTARRQFRAGGGGTGAISAPIGTNFGVQGEGILATFNGRKVAGVGGHLFWRDPNRGLIGVYGSGTYFGVVNGLGVARAALEGEAYLGSFTLEGMAGAETGRRNLSSNPFVGVTAIGVPYLGYSFYNMHPRFYDKAMVSYYATENLKLSVGQLYTGGKVMATLGAEYAFPISPGVAGSLFADGFVGGRSNGVRAGLKIYFGQRDKSLIRRHREDDPPINLPIDLLTLANSRSNAIIPLPMANVPPIVKPPPVCEGIVFEGACLPADSK